MASNRHFGRIDDKEETTRIVASLPQPLFALNLFEAESGAGKDVFLWKAEESLTGTVAPPDLQTIGDCISHGFGRAIDALRWIRIARNENEDFVPTSTEAIYGGSRVQVGQGRAGTQDGSVGAWALKWCLEGGIVPRGVYGQYDLTVYSGKVAREWGMPGAGCPPPLLPVAAEYPLKTGSLVRSYKDVRDAIAVSKSPVTVSSNVGFENFVRGSDGFIKPNGTWPHCMHFIGVSDNPVRPGCVCRQSWGDGSPSGPLLVTLPHGPTLQLYEGMFLVDADVVEKMVGEGDSFALSDMIGFPKKDLPLLHMY